MESLHGYRLLHEGSKVFARMSENGICVDLDYCKKQEHRLTKRVELLERKIAESENGKRWLREFGGKTNYGSGDQLAKLLFDVLGETPVELTATGKPSTGKDVLKDYDHIDVVGWFVEMKSLEKTRSTYVRGLVRESFDGYLHPFFNLHTTVTFRSSSDHPNFQNFPVRDKAVMKLVRSAIRPRPGCRLVEHDYGGIEVKVAACYHKDPTMLAYINDPTKDMHRDMAAQCYCVGVDEVSKEMRFYGKNGWVFPQFYGSFYANCAQSMWNAITEADLKTKDGISVMTRLHEEGIHELGDTSFDAPLVPGTFVAHLKDVEKDFWGNRFGVYGKWKRDWYSKYLHRGYFDTLTGFRISGVFRRNEVVNYPIQGSAFHCLLLAAILIQKILDKRKMKTLLVGQIHDSIVADVPEDEFDEYVELANHVMTVLVPKFWKWIIVPLEVEAEATPVDRPWAEKELVK